MTLSGCGEDESASAQRGDAAAMQFQVDESLLGETRTIEPFGVVVRAPAGWAALPQQQMERFSQQVSAAAAADGAPVEPLAAFMRMGTPAPSVLIVSSIPLGAEQSELAEYARQLREQFGEVREGRFRVNGLEVRQYLIQPQGQVNFKLLVDAGEASAGITGRRLQLDYVVPQEAWAAQVRAVESSIGSLRPVGR